MCRRRRSRVLVGTCRAVDKASPSNRQAPKLQFKVSLVRRSRCRRRKGRLGCGAAWESPPEQDAVRNPREALPSLLAAHTPSGRAAGTGRREVGFKHTPCTAASAVTARADTPPWRLPDRVSTPTLRLQQAWGTAPSSRRPGELLDTSMECVYLNA